MIPKKKLLPQWVTQTSDMRIIYGTMRKTRKHLPSFDELTRQEKLALAKLVRSMHRFCGATYTRKQAELKSVSETAQP